MAKEVIYYSIIIQNPSAFQYGIVHTTGCIKHFHKWIVVFHVTNIDKVYRKDRLNLIISIL